MKNIDFSVPTRQNALGIFVMWSRNIWRSFNILLPIGVVLFNVGKKGVLSSLMLTFIIIFIFILILIFSYLQYLKFVFFVEDNQFVLEKGVFNKTRLNVPFDRIQSVHLSQSLVQRILGITGLEVDSAGSKAKEMEIAALDKAYANGLRSYLLEQMEAAREELSGILPQDPADPADFEAAVTPTQAQKPAFKAKTLLKLDLGDLLLVGLTQNHIRTGLAAVGIIFAYVQRFRDFSDEEVTEMMEDSASILMQSGAAIIATGITVFLLISLMASLVMTLFKYYGFKAVSEAKGIRITAGLLARREYQVPENKIQYLEWRSNPLRKLLELKSVFVRQASSGQRNNAGAVVIPGCKPHHINEFYGQYMPETLEAAAATFKPDKFYGTRLLLFFSLVPTLGMLALSYWVHPWFQIGILVFAVGAPVFIIKYVASISFNLYSNGLRVEKGWVFKKVVDLKLFKVQNISLNQTLFMERRNLYSVDIHTAAGTLNLPFVPAHTAFELTNFLLYQVSCSTKKWM